MKTWQEKVEEQRKRVALEMKCPRLPIPRGNEYIPGGIALEVPERRQS